MSFHLELPAIPNGAARVAPTLLGGKKIEGYSGWGDPGDVIKQALVSLGDCAELLSELRRAGERAEPRHYDSPWSQPRQSAGIPRAPSRNPHYH